MISILLQVVIPVFFVIAVGFVLAASFKIDPQSLNRVALYGAMPALVSVTLIRSELTLEDATILVSGNVLFLVAMGALAWLLSQGLSASSRRGFIATSVFGNAANMMLPVSLFAFGEEGLHRALILYVFSSVIFFTLGPLVFRGSGSAVMETGRAIIKLPVIWAAVLGLGLNLADWTPPTAADRGLELLGNAAIPMVLLALGLQIQKSGILAPQPVNWLGAVFKLAIGPVVGYFAALLVGAEGVDLAVLTLLAAMPPAVNNFILAYEFGGNAEEVAKTVILGTVGAFISLSIVVWLIGRLDTNW